MNLKLLEAKSKIDLTRRDRKVFLELANKSNLMEIAKNNENVLTYPEPRVRFREFADSGLKFQLLLWIAKPERRGRTVDEINTRIYHRFSENSITIPYPTMNLLMKEK